MATVNIAEAGRRIGVLRQQVEKGSVNGNGHADLVVLNQSVDEAQHIIFQQVNKFLPAIANSQPEQRKQILQRLSGDSAETIAGTLVVYLQYIEGFDRAHWFPEVVDGMTQILRDLHEDAKAGHMQEKLWDTISQLPDTTSWMPQEIRHDIMKHLEKNYVDIVSESDTGGAFITHSQARAPGA